MALAQARQIDAVLVTELSRWGRSTTDLLATLKELEARRVSVVALNGMTFDPATPHGQMMATVLAGIAEFERELIQERIRSGIAAAKPGRLSPPDRYFASGDTNVESGPTQGKRQVADEETKPKRQAKDNPWYRLATLHGEPSGSHDEIAQKNRVTWNRWMASRVSDDLKTALREKGWSDDELKPFSEDERQSIEDQIRSSRGVETIDFQDTEFEATFFVAGFVFPSIDLRSATFNGGASFDSVAFSGDAYFDSAAFSGDASFSSAAFSGDGYFGSAAFSGNASFRSAA